MMMNFVFEFFDFKIVVPKKGFFIFFSIKEEKRYKKEKHTQKNTKINYFLKIEKHTQELKKKHTHKN
jgi:hypothetical protein